MHKAGVDLQFVQNNLSVFFDQKLLSKFGGCRITSFCVQMAVGELGAPFLYPQLLSFFPEDEIRLLTSPVVVFLQRKKNEEFSICS